MTDDGRDLLTRAAAPAYRRIDRDPRAAPSSMRRILRQLRADLFRPGVTVEGLQRLLGLPTSHKLSTASGFSWE